jgi:hypothetical protein
MYPSHHKRRQESTERTQKDKKVQTEIEVWEQHVQQDALAEARTKEKTLTLGDTEAQLRKVSEEVTRAAQEKRNQTLRT